MARTAWDVALDLLSRRAHTEAELLRKLRQRNYPEDEGREVIAKARRLALMESDEAIAERYATSLATKRGATPRWATEKLRQRGVAGPLAEAAVRQAFSNWDARAAALEIAGTDRNAPRVARRLKRRGFPTDVIAWVVRRLEADPQES